VMIATDSEYVVRGMSMWVTRQRRHAENRDLWEALIEDVESWDLGVRVQFYLVERRFKAKADQCAKAGAASASPF